jgi:hypothetical protein
MPNLHRLKLAPAPPPMPAFAAGPPCRPGERREPLHLAPFPYLAFASAAATRGLALGCASELALEAVLIRDDYERLGWAEGFTALLAASEEQRFTVALPAPYRRYRNHLLRRGARELERCELEEPVSVPLRLFPRVLTLDYQEALIEARLDQAITLELAALCDGRTMSEYALLYAAQRA